MRKVWIPNDVWENLLWLSQKEKDLHAMVRDRADCIFAQVSFARNQLDDRNKGMMILRILTTSSADKCYLQCLDCLSNAFNFCLPVTYSDSVREDYLKWWSARGQILFQLNSDFWKEMLWPASYVLYSHHDFASLHIPSHTWLELLQQCQSPWCWSTIIGLGAKVPACWPSISTQLLHRDLNSVQLRVR